MSQYELRAEIESLRRRVRDLEKIQACLTKVEGELTENERPFHAPSECTFERPFLSKMGTTGKKAEDALHETSRLNQILIDSMPCVALLLRPHSREIVASNAEAAKVGAVPGAQCFATWGQRSSPCPWCLAPQLWETGEAQHLEVKALGIIFDAHWIPVSPDLYMHYAFDVTEQRRAEAMLKASEERLSLALAGANLGIWEWDLTTGKAVWSQRTLEMLGYQEDELEPDLKTWKRLVHPDDWPNITEALNLHIKGKLPTLEVEYRILNKSGDWRWVQIRGKVISAAADGKPTMVAGVLADITDRKKAEEALNESEEKYRLIFSREHDAIVLTDAETNGFLDANESAERLWGYSREELLSMTALDISSDLKASRRGLAAGARPEGVEIPVRWHRKKDGTIFPVEISAGSFDWRGRRVVCSIIRDISDRLRAETALRDSEKRYRSLFENMLEGYVYCKMIFENNEPQDFIYLAVNAAFEELTGLKDVVGKKASEVIPHLKEHDPELLEIHGNVALSGQPERFETYVASLESWFSASVYSPEKGYFISVFDDITHRKRAEEALRESEELHRTLFEEARDAIMIIDAEGDEIGRIVSANRMAASIHGYPLEEFLTLNLADLDTPESAVRMPQKIKTVLAGKWLREEAAHRRKDGSTFPLEVAAGLVEIRGHKYCLAIDRDITERKRAEEALRQSEMEKSLILESAAEWFMYYDLDLRVRWANRVAAESVGQKPGALVGRHCYEIWHGRQAPCEDCPVALARETGLPQRAEKTTSDGRTWYLRGYPVIDRQGQTVGLIELIQDITERKRAEEALRESEQRYRSLFEESRDAVYSVSRDGEITDANPSAMAIFGYTREEIIGKNIRELYADPSDRPKFREEIEKRGFVKDYEIKLRKKDGTDIACLITSSVQLGNNGGIVGYRGIIRDLTIRKELQRQLLQAQKMEAIGTLAGGIAHDFNNLLQVTMGYSELLLQERQPQDKDYADLQKIYQAARSGADLVQGLLTFSRKVDSKPVPLNLNRQISQVEKLLRRAIPKMVAIQMDLSDDLAEVSADPTQVEQILMNLAVNARDAMPDSGRLTIVTKNATLDEEYCEAHIGAQSGKYVMLSVSDTGHGMRKDTIEHIFEPFYTTKEVGRGTGLGLAMVYGIVKQHDGFIICHSEVGHGTTFEIYFPAIESQMKADLEDSAAMPALGDGTVLLVDDDALVRELATRILTKHGYTVLQATNGREALDLLEKERSQISLVILDLIMPEMGGKECLTEILKIDPQAKVLVASGYSADASVKDTAQMGAKGFVAKPFRFKDLLRQARKTLDES
jgi:two-component system cell cycle sensor histidine kinase/response regulator CckA